MGWDKTEFLDEIKAEFEVRLGDIEIPDSCYDIEEECWNEDKVRELEDCNLDELFGEAVTNIVENNTHWTDDCWDICKDIIGSGDFSDYNDLYPNPKNVYQMTQAALDQYAKEELDFDDIFSDWLGECDPPEDIDVLKEQAKAEAAIL